MNIIVCEYIRPPRRTTAYDWTAYDADADDNSATGYGATREAALTDLVEKIQMEAYAEGRKDEREDWIKAQCKQSSARKPAATDDFLSRCYQDAAGTIPVTAVGQQVGHIASPTTEQVVHHPRLMGVK